MNRDHRELRYESNCVWERVIESGYLDAVDVLQLLPVDVQLCRLVKRHVYLSLLKQTDTLPECSPFQPIKKSVRLVDKHHPQGRPQQRTTRSPSTPAVTVTCFQRRCICCLHFHFNWKLPSRWDVTYGRSSLVHLSRIYNYVNTLVARNSLCLSCFCLSMQAKGLLVKTYHSGLTRQELSKVPKFSCGRLEWLFCPAVRLLVTQRVEHELKDRREKVWNVIKHCGSVGFSGDVCEQKQSTNILSGVAAVYFPQHSNGEVDKSALFAVENYKNRAPEECKLCVVQLEQGQLCPNMVTTGMEGYCRLCESCCSGHCYECGRGDMTYEDSCTSGAIYACLYCYRDVHCQFPRCERSGTFCETCLAPVCLSCCEDEGLGSTFQCTGCHLTSGTKRYQPWNPSMNE